MPVAKDNRRIAVTLHKDVLHDLDVVVTRFREFTSFKNVSRSDIITHALLRYFKQMLQEEQKEEEIKEEK